MSQDKTKVESESLSLSRRKFLAVMGSVTAASAAVPPLEALTSAGFPKMRLNALDISAGRSGSPVIHFRETFAPTEKLVKAVEQPYRQDICLNGAWQFQPMALPDGFQEGQDPAPALSSADPSRWEGKQIYVPSPWNVNSFADHHGEGGDFHCYPSYPEAWEQVEMGWLRKTFTVPVGWTGRRILLHFDAVAGNAEIFVNGKSVGNHFDIFLPFDLDVTSAIKFGGSNEVLVGVRKASLFDRRGAYGRRTYQGGSFWGQHIAGIWQDVFLVALPPVRIADVFVKPDVRADTLGAEIEIQNDSDDEIEVTISAQAFPWISKADKRPLRAALPSSELTSVAALELPEVQVKVPAHGSAVATLQGAVKSRLKLWSNGSPSLYGLVVKLHQDSKTIDSKYTRFGWRQISFQGSVVLLNGRPIILRGDSWHFMGIPQMTRRYAWAWFTAMQNAGLNAVRLHAQPYPSFYLDVADEMGILVLDETAVWASDGGPKLDDPAFWQDTERHLAALVQRDRNHPSVLGWSVSNEVMPIVRGVMRNPPGMMEELLRHYSIWADICRKYDPTRPWISADGENDGQGRLPVYMVHYGGDDAMQRAAESGKPWGVGEAGDAYYGSPVQVAETNGDRAYESFEGRMEGVAISSYESLIEQQEHHAIYRSVFNLVWYGLQPLALGMKDVTRPPTPEDGIFFGDNIEGLPGVQPQRLGPYCTTLNPGYDRSLPLYETWPLFEAIRDAASEPPKAGKWSKVPEAAPARTEGRISTIKSAGVLGGESSTLAAQLQNLGVPLGQLSTAGIPQLLFVDGITPPKLEAREQIDKVLHHGGTVLVWGVAQNSLPWLNAWLPARLAVTQRTTSSLLPGRPNPIIFGLEPDNLYCCDQRPPEISDTGLAGPLVEQGMVLLTACNTDWLKWNNQPEYAKTAMVVRSERETKPSGVVLVERHMGAGRLLITTLPATPNTVKAETIDRTLLANLGLTLHAGMDSGKPLLRTGQLVRALACGFFPVEADAVTAADFAKIAHEDSGFRAGAAVGGKKWQPVVQENGVFDLSRLNLSGSSQNAEAYLSFWVNSPRSLEDLLLEPNLPRVDFQVSQRDAIQIWLNGKKVADKTGNETNAVAEALRLRSGWNHLLVKLAHTTGRWELTAHFAASQPGFIAQMDSSLEKP
jgi:beta-galactosidase